MEDGISLVTYFSNIIALGGYGTPVRCQGLLIEIGIGGCQPGIITPEGKRFRISLDNIIK